METRPRSILYYETDDGMAPFIEWFRDTKDIAIKKAVRARLKRVEQGNLGDCKALGDGVFELRFLGLGIRIYYAEVGDVVILLLWGGGKNTPKEQERDIQRAKSYWADFKKKRTEE